MRRLGAAVLLTLALTSGCRLFEREPAYPQYYYPSCQPCVPCQPCCTPTTVQSVPATARPVIGR